MIFSKKELPHIGHDCYTEILMMEKSLSDIKIQI